LKPRYVRFRADPKKVRVSILRCGERAWRVTVAQRDRTRARVIAWGTSPKKALVRALLHAERDNLSGLNLSLSWAHEHPFP
jgi:hypothetical protein